MPFTWVVTKSQPHADSVVIQLRRQGFDALAVCCIEHRWQDWPALKQLGSAGPALLFVTSRASAARVEVPRGTLIAAIAPATSATLEARGMRVALSAHGGVRELAQAVVDSTLIPDGADVFYPTSDAALRQPEHLAGVAILQRRFKVHTQAVYATVAPDNLDLIENKALVHLAQGDLEGARRVVAEAPPGVEPTALVTFFGNYWDLFWALDDSHQRLLLRLPPSAYDGDRGAWGLVRAQTHFVRGDTAMARAYADSARLGFEETLADNPDDPQRRVLRGLALAYMGRKAEAIREGERGLALVPAADDGYTGPYLQHQLARIYILTGEQEKALDLLEPLLREPYYLSPAWLRIDPTFDALRGNPRFVTLSEAKGP